MPRPLDAEAHTSPSALSIPFPLCSFIPTTSSQGPLLIRGQLGTGNLLVSDSATPTPTPASCSSRSPREDSSAGDLHISLCLSVSHSGSESSFTLWSQLESLPQAPIPTVVGPSLLGHGAPHFLCSSQLQIPCDHAQPQQRNLG